MRIDMSLMQQLIKKTDSNYLCYLNYYDKSTKQQNMNMDMAELQKIQTDPGTQFSDGQDTKFVTNTQSEKLNLTKCCKQGYNTPVYSSIFNTPVHPWRK